MKRYALMHRDSEAAAFFFNGSRVADASIKDPVLVPPGVDTPEKLMDWWSQRSVPVSRLSYLRELDASFPDEKEYLLANLGLSMSDHYWLKPDGASMRWKDVSPFTNEFAEGRLRSSDTGSTEAFSPNASLQGQMDKKWVCHNSERLLMKRYPENPFSTVNEVFASRLYDNLGFPHHVHYDFARDRNNNQYCFCKAFTNEDTEFIPAVSFCEGRKLPYAEFLSKATQATGLPEEEISSFLDIQTMMDFLITNRDRHLNNFGFLRDSHTLRYTGMVPVFDNDRSMLETDRFHEIMGRASIRVALRIKVNTFSTSERDNLKRVRIKDRTAIDISLLPQREDVCSFYTKHLENIRGKDFYADYVSDLFSTKKALFTQWQRGKNLGEFLK